MSRLQVPYKPQSRFNLKFCWSEALHQEQRRFVCRGEKKIQFDIITVLPSALINFVLPARSSLVRDNNPRARLFVYLFPLFTLQELGDCDCPSLRDCAEQWKCHSGFMKYKCESYPGLCHQLAVITDLVVAVSGLSVAALFTLALPWRGFFFFSLTPSSSERCALRFFIRCCWFCHVVSSHAAERCTWGKSFR